MLPTPDDGNIEEYDVGAAFVGGAAAVVPEIVLLCNVFVTGDDFRCPPTLLLLPPPSLPGARRLFVPPRPAELPPFAAGIGGGSVAFTWKKGYWST